MFSEELGPDNAIWDDGEWISLETIDTHLERLELQAKYPGVDLDLVTVLNRLVWAASDFHRMTGGHLKVYGQIGELFGAIAFGIKLHRNDSAQGSDGKLGNDFVEIKTITPFKETAQVEVKTTGHFSKILIVRIDDGFEIMGRLVDRKSLPNRGGKMLKIRWGDLASIHPDRQRGYCESDYNLY